ncbi:MAG: LytR family transcriptional regulator, partial [Ignavibacteriales bacterium]|nr:LytR family transcriptional regulator [Ignavibacteriales bacterium]
LNGCGVNGMGEIFTEFLRESDFDVIHTGNYVSFDVEHTLVVDRRGDPANAAAVAKALGVGKKQIVRELNEDYLLDVSVVIGKDFGALKPTQ